MKSNLNDFNKSLFDNFDSLKVLFIELFILLFDKDISLLLYFVSLEEISTWLILISFLLIFSSLVILSLFVKEKSFVSLEEISTWLILISFLLIFSSLLILSLFVKEKSFVSLTSSEIVLISCFALLLNSFVFLDLSLLIGVNGSNSEVFFLLFAELNKGLE